MNHQPSRPLVVTLAALGLLCCSVPGFPTTFTVDTTEDFVDDNPGNGVCSGGPALLCSLRAAIMETNALGAGHTVDLPAGHYRLSIPGAEEDEALSGDLDVLRGKVIAGAGADVTIIDAQGIDRVFDVLASTTIITDVTITGGRVAGSGRSGVGGGLYSAGRLEVREAVVRDNRATRGGGIGLQDTSLDLEDSALIGNIAEEFSPSGEPLVVPSGGGLYAEFDLLSFPVTVDVQSSTVVGNRCGPGGAAGCDGAAGISMVRCEIGHRLDLDSSTLSGNVPGGVFLEDCNAEVFYSTVVGNSGGGLTNVETVTPYEGIRLFHSILSGNSPDCLFEEPNSHDVQGNFNSDSDGTCSLSLALGDLPNTDPMLHPLGHFDPPSGQVDRSHHPEWGSPVVDRTPTAAPFTTTTTDQDGYPRPMDADNSGLDRYDIGSIEVLPCSPDSQVDLVLEGKLLFSETFQACRSVSTAARGFVVAPITFSSVRVWARDSVTFNNGFVVERGADFSAGNVRWAGYVP